MVTLDAYVGLRPDQIDRTRALVDYALLGAPQRVVQSNRCAPTACPTRLITAFALVSELEARRVSDSW